VTKIHSHLVVAVADTLDEIFFAHKHAEKCVEATLFRNKKWGSRDRKFFAESVYECVRWWSKIWFGLNQKPAAGQGILVWQVGWYLHTQEWVSLPSLQNFGKSELTVDQKKAVTERILQIPSAQLSREIQESIPGWLDVLGAQDLGVRWPGVLRFLNTQAPIDLRVNSLLSSPAQVIQALSQEGIEACEVPDSPGALTLPIRKNVFMTQAFKSGLFEVQDRGSQKLGDLLPVKPGDRVVDACAGAGGKSLQLAARMSNKGKLIAMDIHGWKLEELRKRASRAKVQCIETRHIDSTKVIKRLQDSADAVLLDVPCSGLGVLRRHPDTKWKMSLDELSKLNGIQTDILGRYSEMVKPGGFLVYATCSILKSENENRVDELMATKPGQWNQLRLLNIDPELERSDGFFGCLLQKSR
jgi:16S rRNA (cytosine967-C5)-methyltransferase